MKEESHSLNLEEMASKAIHEAFGKNILVQYLEKLSSENCLGKELSFPVKTATVTAKTNFKKLAEDTPWLESVVCLGNVSF